jgi:hypothetical protein
MCTAGVLRIGEGDYLLFKNKDFGRGHFEDHVVATSDVFGVAGTTTWAGHDPGLDQFSGFSIGANDSGLLACDTNVRTFAGHANYDDLVEIALRHGTGVASGLEAVRVAVENQSYMWGNLMLIDGRDQLAIEVKGGEIHATAPDGPAVCTNHHLVLGGRADDASTSYQRLAAARRRIATTLTLEDVFALLATHDDGDTGICNHSAHETVYSYVLRRRGGRTTLYVIQGKPCEAGPHQELELPLGSAWSVAAAAAFCSAYPAQAVG